MTDEDMRELRAKMMDDFAPRRPQQLPPEAYRTFRGVKDERRLADLEATQRLEAARNGLRA